MNRNTKAHTCKSDNEHQTVEEGQGHLSKMVCNSSLAWNEVITIVIHVWDIFCENIGIIKKKDLNNMDSLSNFPLVLELHPRYSKIPYYREFTQFKAHASTLNLLTQINTYFWDFTFSYTHLCFYFRSFHIVLFFIVSSFNFFEVIFSPH